MLLLPPPPSPQIRFEVIVWDFIKPCRPVNMIPGEVITRVLPSAATTWRSYEPVRWSDTGATACALARYSDILCRGKLRKKMQYF